MGGRGGERGRDKREKQREETILTRKGSQLTRKQRKVSKQLWCRTVPMPWSMEGSGIIESLICCSETESREGAGQRPEGS